MSSNMAQATYSSHSNPREDSDYSDDFDELIDELDQVDTSHVSGASHPSTSNGNGDKTTTSHLITIASKSPLPESNYSLISATAASSALVASVSSAALVSLPKSRSVSRSSSAAASVVSSAKSSNSRKTSTLSSTSITKSGSKRTRNTSSISSSSSQGSSASSSCTTPSGTTRSHEETSATSSIASSLFLEKATASRPLPKSPSRDATSSQSIIRDTVPPVSPAPAAGAVLVTPTSPPSNAPSMLLLSTTHPPLWPSTTVNNTLIVAPTSTATSKQHHDSSSLLASPPPRMLLPTEAALAGEATMPEAPLQALDPHSQPMQQAAVLSPMSRLRVMVESAHSSTLGLVTASTSRIDVQASRQQMSQNASATSPSTCQTWAEAAAAGSHVASYDNGITTSDALPNVMLMPSAAPGLSRVPSAAPFVAANDPYSSASFASLSSDSVKSDSSAIVSKSVSSTATPNLQTRAKLSVVPSSSVAAVKPRRSAPLVPEVPVAPAIVAHRPSSEPTLGPQTISNTIPAALTPRVMSSRVDQPPVKPTPVAALAPSPDSTTSTSMLHAQIQAAKRRLDGENTRILLSMPANARRNTRPSSKSQGRRGKGEAHVPGAIPIPAHADSGLDHKVVPKVMLDRIKMNMLLYDMKHLASLRS